MESIKELLGDDKVVYLPKEQWAEPKDTPDRGIKSLEGLQYAVNLETLDLSENRVSDLMPLKNLTKLTYIELDRNMLGDLNPLSNLTNLMHLNIYNNDVIVDMTPLAKLPKLEWLDLHFCNRGKQTVNVEPLGNITTLKMVNLESNLVSDISFASKLVNVEVIGVGANNITDMTPLSDMINKIYYDLEGSYEVNEEKTYVGMYAQNLSEPINKNVGCEESIITIANPVKGLDKFIKTYYDATAPGLDFLSGEENENISLNYNEETKEIQVTVKENLQNTPREIEVSIMLDYGKYCLGIKLNITQAARK